MHTRPGKFNTGLGEGQGDSRVAAEWGKGEGGDRWVNQSQKGGRLHRCARDPNSLPRLDNCPLLPEDLQQPKIPARYCHVIFFLDPM